ncbi:MAG: MFS transporter [Alphaproteobacteria bacterium]
MDERTSQASGWALVAICFLALGGSFSARSLLGLTMPLWESELGWSRSFVSTGGALALVTMAIVAPIAGNLVDRIGVRPLLGGGLVMVALAMGLAGAASAEWQFLVAYSALGGIGFGTVANHVVSTAIALRFTAGRGLATGIAVSGSTAGQLVVIPLLAAVMTSLGWRLSYASLGLFALALAPVVLILLGSRSRASAGWARDPGAAVEPLSRRLGALGRSWVFHALFWSYVVCGFTTTGVIETHLLPYAAACGFPPLESATAYGVLSAFNLGGMVLSGFLTDRVNRSILLGTIYILRGLSFILLGAVVGDLSLLFLFAVAFGLVDYATVPPTASLVASHIGLRVMDLTMGLLSAGHALGGAAGAFAGGVLFDLFATYDWVWTASTLLAISAGLLAYTIREAGGSLRPAAVAAR